MENLKRKIKKSVVMFATLCALCFALITANAAHEHTYEILTQLKPTCTEGGKTVYVCASCGDSYTNDEEALGHDFELYWRVDFDSTCAKEGEKSRHCTRCSEKTDILKLNKLPHSFEKRTVEPTCTQQGYDIRTCRVCGLEMTDNIVKANGHKASLWIIEKEATCEEAGLRYTYCTVCNETLQKLPINATGHYYNDAVVEPTCTQKGYSLHTCMICGKSYTDKEKSALGHKFSDSGRVIENPTCTVKGRQALTCLVCSVTEEQPIPALGHDYSSEWTIDKPATCTAFGEKSHHCTRCNSRRDVVSTDKIDHNVVTDKAIEATCTQSGLTEGSHCTLCEKAIVKQTKIAALGHDYKVTKVLKEPTCTQDGTNEAVCSRCGDRKEQTVSKLGHSYSTQWTVDTQPTCTAQGEKSYHCTRCTARTQIIAIERTAHSEVKDKEVKATCTQSGLTEGSHCSFCAKVIVKQEKTAALGHDYKVTKTIKEPSCTQSGTNEAVCSRCGDRKEQTVSKLGHSYSTQWTVDKNPTCTAQGEKSYHCTRCTARTQVTAIERTAHSVVTDKEVKATCTQSGLTEGSHCSFCAKVIVKQKKTAALGHDYKVTKTVSKPTCTQDGTNNVKCSRCGEETKQTVSKLGHSFSDKWTVDKAATCTAQGEKSRHCTRCSKRTDIVAIERAKHKTVTDKEVKATCTKAGKTQGSHCSVCGKVITPQTKTQPTGHKKTTVITKATTKKDGKIVVKCKACSVVISTETVYKIKSVLLSKKQFVFDSKAHKPSVTVTDSKGKKLQEGKAYSLKYSSSAKEIGEYSVTVTFKGNYSGSKTLSFTVIPKAPTGLDCTQSQTSVTLKWNKVSSATGYVVYEYDAKTKKYSQIGKTKELYIKIKNLKSAEKHSYAVRAYKTVQKKNFNSSYSAVKATATKPYAPKVNIISKSGSAVLSWNNVGNCEYEIYMSDKKNGKYVCVGTTKKLKFTYKPSAKGKTLYFKVKACVKNSTKTLSSVSSDIKAVYIR